MVPPPSPKYFTPKVISEMFINIETIRPETLLKNTGEPQAAISFIILKEILGFVNFKSAFLKTKGIRVMMAQLLIEIEVARAEPTTSILSTKRKKSKRPMVRRFEKMFINILSFTKPLIRR